VSAADALPEGAVAVLGGLNLRPDGPVVRLVFSADGKSLLTLGQDTTLQVWDSATGKEQRRLRLSNTGAGRVAEISADGKTAVVALADGTVRFFDTARGEEGLLLGGADAVNVYALSLSADGKTLVTANGTTAVVWQAPVGSIGPKVAGVANLSAVAITPNGKQFVLARPDQSLRLMDSATGNEVKVLQPAAPRSPAFQGLPRHLAISPDGRLLAYNAGEPVVTVFSLETGQVVTRLSQQNGVQGITFSPNGRFLAVGGFPGVHVYGIYSGRELRVLEARPGMASPLVAFSPDGRTVAAMAQDGSLRLWDVVEGLLQQAPAGHSAHVQKMLFLEGGKRLASYGGDARVLLWDVRTARMVDELRGPHIIGNWLAATADGKGVQLFGLEGRMHTWRPGTGVEEVRKVLPAGPSYRQVLSPGGKFLASFGTDSKLRVYDLRGPEGRERALDLPREGGWTNQLVFSPDGHRLATAGGDGVLRVWDSLTGRLVHAFDGSRPDSPRLNYAAQLEFSRDGRCLLMCGNDCHLLEIASGKDRMHVENLAGGIQCAALSPDGRLAALGSANGTVRVYGVVGGNERMERRGRQGLVQSLAFCDDGRLLASGGSNGAIVVWKMPEPPAATGTLAEGRGLELWEQLAADEASTAAQAMEALTGAPGTAVPLLRARLAPRDGKPDVARLEKYIAELDSDDFRVREKASRALASAGSAAEGALRKALTKEGLPVEVRRRIGELLDRLDSGGAAAERLRGLRAIEVLERIGTPAAKQALAELAREAAETPLIEEIEASLRRLGER
jgi:WD40 repeat protein